MREWVLAIKAILDSWQQGTGVDFRGEYTTHTLMTPAFNPGPNPYGVPKILVGALGARMNEMAAEVADGILVMPFNSGRHMRERTVPAIERGLAAAGRTLADLEITVEVIVGVGRDDQELEAAKGVRGLLSASSPPPSKRPRHERAKELGVCTRVLPNDAVLPAALELARDIAANTAPLSVAFSKRVLWAAGGCTPEQIEQLETDAHRHLMGHADSREGVLAFLERRPPAWQGRLADEWPEGWPGRQTMTERT